MIKKCSIILLKAAVIAASAVILAVLATSFSVIYDFRGPRPFSGPDIFNPYEGLDSADCWKRANFHTHTKVEGIFNECDWWPAQVDSFYRDFGYDIVTFSNHNELTVHPYDPSLQVNVYEHGLNLLKFHKLVFGSGRVNRFDNLVPVFAFQRQFQLDLLGRDSDFIQLNHPLRTPFSSKKTLEKLEGYRIMELDSGKSTENEYWDWALSAGHYSFGLANDDLHYPDRSGRFAVRCSFLCCPDGEYENIRETLLSGRFYSMRVPDYGRGDWDAKRSGNADLPYIRDIGIEGGTIRIALSRQADSIKFTGQSHKVLHLACNSSSAHYTMTNEDPYARVTAYFKDGEVIYSNPFARYDASLSETPYTTTHSANIPLTISYNILIVILCTIAVTATRKIFSKL